MPLGDWAATCTHCAGAFDPTSVVQLMCGTEDAERSDISGARFRRESDMVDATKYTNKLNDDGVRTHLQALTTVSSRVECAGHLLPSAHERPKHTVLRKRPSTLCGANFRGYFLVIILAIVLKYCELFNERNR